MISATVEIQRVRFKNDDNSWVVAQARLDDQQSDPESIPPQLKRQALITVKGDFGGAVSAGDIYDIIGEEEMHPVYGTQVRVSYAAVCIQASARHICAFLKKFPQIGTKRAREIIDHFGGFQEIFDVLDNNPTRLTEISGISETRVASIVKEYHKHLNARENILFGVRIGLDAHLVGNLIAKFTQLVEPMVTEDPYVLMQVRGIDFAVADKIAREAFDMALDDPRRLAAAALLVLDLASREGHTYVTAEWLNAPPRFVAQAYKECGITAEQVVSGARVLSVPRVVRDYTVDPQTTLVGDRIYLADLRAAELIIAHKLKQLLEVRSVD